MGNGTVDDILVMFWLPERVFTFDLPKTQTKGL